VPNAKAEPCVFVVFGGTGDLMRRKLLPALAYLADARLLPERCQVLAVSRDRGLSDTKFRTWAQKSLAAGAAKQRKMTLWCEACLHHQAIDDKNAADYERLAVRIAEIERSAGLPANRVFYLALPPSAFPSTIEALGNARLNRSAGWTRLVIEKPFGSDLASAQRLNALVHRYFDEAQVYRIDHYLGKETVQNLLAFRFGNTLFESAWNRDHIQAMQISVAEALGVEHRAGYYEQAGALRDMVQNHLTQLLTLTAMEVPAALEADSIRFEKIKVLRSVAPIRHDAIVFAQYTAAEAKGKKLPGYRQEPGVAPRSKTETFVALKTEIENWRWQGVPFYLRTGKRLARRVTEITINFRTPPVALFTSFGCVARGNTLVITLEPDEGFELSFEVKSPGEQFALKTQRMKFRYSEVFGALSGGYETLLLDIMRGDQTLFVHGDEAEAAWRLYAPLLRNLPPLYFYPAGSWGPAEAANFGTYPPTSPEWSPALNRRA
jgi:glucose-6-phosphate 1-dehydrogenase